MALNSALYGTNLLSPGFSYLHNVPPTRPLLVSDFNIWCKLSQSTLRGPLKASNSPQGSQLSMSDCFSLLKLYFCTTICITSEADLWRIDDAIRGFLIRQKLSKILGGVGHCFAWHVRVSLDLFYFILKQKNLYIVGCAQCIWDITTYFLLPEFKYIYLIYILSYNQTLAYTTKINFFPLHFNNFLEENLSKSPSVSQLLPVVIPS